MQTDPSRTYELSLAGGLLAAPKESLELIRPIVSLEHIKDPVARAVYQAVQTVVDNGELQELPYIAERAHQIEHCIDYEVLADLLKQAPLFVNLEAMAEKVKEAAIEREVKEICSAALFNQIDTTELLTKLQEQQRRKTSTAITSFEAMMNLADHYSDASEGKTQPFVSTGFPSLDKQLAGGFVQSGLITLAARPGTGKTTAAINLAQNVALRDKPVLYFSLEMDAKQISSRRVASYMGLNYSNFYRGKLENVEQEKRANQGMNDLSKTPFSICDTPCTIDDIERNIRCANPPPALVVIDHIGLIKNSTGRTRYEAMTEISHRLKQLALSTGIPILALSQLNRQSQTRESKIPSVADLRDTGAIEEDSDVVMLLHRPAMYANADEAPKPWEPQELQIIVGKNRHGMQGTVSFDFIGMTAGIKEIGVNQ